MRTEYLVNFFLYWASNWKHFDCESDALPRI